MSIRKMFVIIIACLACVVLLLGAFKFKSIWFHFNQRLDALIANTAETPNDIYLSIEGQEVHLDINTDNTVFEMPSLTTEFESNISYTANSRYSLTFAGYPMKSGEILNYRIGSIASGYYIPVNVFDNQTQKTLTFTLRTYPQSLPEFTVSGKSPYPGDYYITPMMPQGGGALYKLDNSGNVLYYKLAGTMLLDFKKADTKDGIRYIYSEQITTRHTPLAAVAMTEWVIMDDHYHELKRIRMQESDRLPESNWPCDAHDIYYVSDDEYYLMTYKNEYVKNIPDDIPQRKPDVLVASNIIQGYRNGHLTFEWDSADYPELYGISSEGNDYTNTTDVNPDYAHANSLDIDKKDGNLIVSFRHLDCVLKIDTSTGKIVWRLGGKNDDFHLTPEQKTSHQHYARYNPNGSITVFDNGNAVKQSRVVEYWLDEDNKSLSKFNAHQINGYYSQATGSAQRTSMDDEVFVIGWGSRDPSSLPLQPNMSEINFTSGKTLFELRFNDNNIQTYRCVKSV